MRTRKVRLRKEPKILDSTKPFHFGSCSSIAITQAFAITEDILIVICKLLKIKKIDAGLSFFEIKKVVNALSRQKKSVYTPNYANLTFGQMLIVLNKGVYLVMFDEHLSYAKDGTIYDSFICHDDLDNIPQGWWKIK